MKLGIDISQIVYKGSGVGTFTDGLVRAILRYDLSHSWIFYFSSMRMSLEPGIIEMIQNKGFELKTYHYPPTFLSTWSNDLHTISHLIPPLFAIPHDLDWFITSDWSEPHLPCKKATIVHDLVFKRYPETVHSSILHTQEKRLQRVQSDSKIIFTDSVSTGEDLLEYYHVNKSQIVVNYPGVEMNKFDTPNNSIIEKFKLHKPYILTVGKLEPRKNIQKLIDAFSNTKTTAQLVIVGADGWGENGKQGSSDDVRFLGYVSDEDLAALYEEALFFVYPSLYEGFGYPILEAMKYGCPVATSNTSSMKEIAEGNAVLFSPESTEKIGASIQELFDDEALRTDLKQKGLKHAASFTWERYYTKLITELEKRK